MKPKRLWRWRGSTSPADTILSGAEPFYFNGNGIGALVCPGFTGTTQSMHYLGERLHGTGYTVIRPRLMGHGISSAERTSTTAADSIESVEETPPELRKTCSQIYMTALSMGGTLTLSTAVSHPDVIKGAIPINAAMHLANPDMAGLAFARSASHRAVLRVRHQGPRIPRNWPMPKCRCRHCAMSLR